MKPSENPNNLPGIFDLGDVDDGNTLNENGELRRDVRIAAIEASKLPSSWQGKDVSWINSTSS